MFTTRNLIVNGGFSRKPPDLRQGWDFRDAGQSVSAWRRVAVPDINRDGLPHSAYALCLEASNGAPPARILQTVSVGGVPTRRFVVRATACGTGTPSDAALVVAVVDPHAPGESREICRFPLGATSAWQRSRAEFDIPALSPGAAVSITLQGPTRQHTMVTITDVRLAGLLRPAEKIAVRFDTRYGMAGASSRLRAFVLEDYLNLVGHRTSLNGGRSFDLYVCQKIQPWLNLAVAKATGTPVVFDLDDNDLLLSALRAFNVRWFARLADGVTLGSDFLRDMADRWNPRTFRQDNPVDVLDPEVVRADLPWTGRLVWFGMPENHWMLDRLGLDRPITTITRGGDIEYRLKTIDRDLVSFDLALLPVFLNDRTRAKNANRLVKCVALGLPFLASDTAEHRRAMTALQLPDDFLVASGHAWRERIADVGRQYSYYRRLVDAARLRAYDVYGIERIASDWMDFCTGLIEPFQAKGRPVRH